MASLMGSGAATPSGTGVMGSEEMYGAAAPTGGGGGGMGGLGAGLGMGSMDWTFGQGKVWDEKTNRQMALLRALIAASGNAGVHSTSSAQAVQAAPIHTQAPMTLAQLLGFAR